MQEIHQAVAMEADLEVMVEVTLLAVTLDMALEAEAEVVDTTLLILDMVETMVEVED